MIAHADLPELSPPYELKAAVAGAVQKSVSSLPSLPLLNAST